MDIGVIELRESSLHGVQRLPRSHGVAGDEDLWNPSCCFKLICNLLGCYSAGFRDRPIVIPDGDWGFRIGVCMSHDDQFSKVV